MLCQNIQGKAKPFIQEEEGGFVNIERKGKAEM